MHLTLSPARARHPVAALLGCAVLIFAMVVVAPSPGPTLRAQVLFDAAHLPWFALLTVVLDAARRRYLAGLLVPFLLVLLLLAVGGELLQLTRAGREVGWQDVARNLAGALLGLAIGQALALRRWRRVGLLLAALLALTLAAPLRLEWARHARAQAAPLLFDAQRTSWAALQSANVATAHRCMPDMTGCVRALAVPVTEQPWPGIRLLELDQDWRGYARLCADVYIEAAAPIRLLAGLRHAGPSEGDARSTAPARRPGARAGSAFRSSV